MRNLDPLYGGVDQPFHIPMSGAFFIPRYPGLFVQEAQDNLSVFIAVKKNYPQDIHTWKVLAKELPSIEEVLLQKSALNSRVLSHKHQAIS